MEGVDGGVGLEKPDLTYLSAQARLIKIQYSSHHSITAFSYVLNEFPMPVLTRNKLCGH